METVNLQPSRKTIEAEACAWIAQLDGSEPSQQDLAALREWMDRSPAHRDAIRRLSLLWDDLNVLTELAVPRPVSERRRARLPGRRLRRASAPLAAAAALLLVMIAMLFSGHWREPATPPVAAAGLQSASYHTAIGQQRTIDMADGSRLTLNTNSRVVVDLTEQSRDIRLLKGEALFEVASDPQRAFRVYAGAGLVRAVGTAFTVRLKSADDVAVTVTEGVVELATLPPSGGDLKGDEPADRSGTLLAKVSAGQIATFGRDLESIRTVGRTEISRRLAWREGMLRFDGEPLSEVVNEVSRYTTQEIRIVDPALRDLRIGGYFKTGETDAMLEALAAGFGVRVERTDDGTVHLHARH